MKGKKDSIELKDTREKLKISPVLTKEENRKIIPDEVKKLNFILSSSNSKIKNYNWEKDGKFLFNAKKYFFTKHEKKILKYLILQEFPENYRPNLWLIASGAKQEMRNNKNYYKNLSTGFPEHIPSPYENQIDLDLHRTFPGDPFFDKEENIQKLKNVLLAYSRRNISIGYCQGFNFIVGRLLKIYNSEEESFWVFVQLIENILPLNYYSELAGIMVDCTILIKLIHLYLPNLYNHLSEIGYEMSLNNVIYKWFVSIFIQNLNENLSFIIWDLLFLDGSIIIFKSALAILKILKKSILSKRSLEDINEVFDEGTRHINDTKTLIYYLIIRIFEFDNTFINKHRLKFQPSILDNIMKANENRMTKIKYYENKENDFSLRRASYVKSNIECYVDWPLCIFDNNYKYNLVSYLVFKAQDPPNFIEDYFKDIEKYKKKEKNILCLSLEKLKTEYVVEEKEKDNSSVSLDDYCIISLKKAKNHMNLNHVKELAQRKKSFTKASYTKELLGFDINTHPQLEAYKNLLIERRPHVCDAYYSIRKSFYFKESEDDLFTDRKARRNLRSNSIYNRNSIVFTKDEFSYERLLSNLSKSKFIFNHLDEFVCNENNKIFESFKQMPFFENEEFNMVINDQHI